MSRRSVGIASAVVVAVAAAAALLAGPWRSLPAGPLGTDPGTPNLLSFDVEAGRSFSYGLVVLENRSEVAAELTGVRLLGSSGSLELVSASVRRLRDAPDHGLIANDRSFPPTALRGALRPAIGARIEPFREPIDGVELVLELRAAGLGVHGFASVAVDYRQGERAFRAVFPSALRVCVARPGSCDVPEPSAAVVY